MPTKTVSLTPKPGRGLFTAWSRFSMGNFVDSFSAWRDVIIQDNAWRVMVDHNLAITLATGGGMGTGPVWATYYYNAVNTAASAATPVSIPLAHVGGVVGNPPTGTAVLGRYDTNVAVLSTTSPHELCFLTIKNRCHIAGATLTGGSVPTIVTKYPAAVSYRWGIPVPTANLSYTPYTNLGATGDKPNQKIYVNLAGSGTEISLVIGTNPITSGGGGSFNASGAGPPHPWNGKTLLVNNASETYKINAITGAAAGTITTNATISRVAVPYEVHYGQLSWTEQPPKYAYSYYNPTTGHSSNASPVLAISEKNVSDVAVEIGGIPTTNDTTNYTRIILWRNEVSSEGLLLHPLRLTAGGGTATIVDGLIRNDLGSGPVSYVDNAPDTELQQVIGKFSKPEDNEPPPADIRFMEYWAGRVWYTTNSAPWRLGYSRETNADELGVGEESFPPRFFIDVSTNNGLVTGMRVVGGALLVATDSYLYFVDGQSPSSYRLERISARGSGVGHFAIDEHPGDTNNNSASALYVSRDKRFWRHFPGGQLHDLGAPIQNKIDDAPTAGVSKPYIVKVFQVQKSWFAALGVLKSSTFDKYNFYFFDFDNSTWYDLGAADGVRDILSIGAGTEFSSGVGAAILGRNTANQIYGFMLNVNSSASAKLTSQWIDMDDPMGKKTLSDIIVYVSDELVVGWVCKVKFDGNDAGAFTTLTETVTLASPRSRGPGIIHFSPQAVGAKQWHAIKIELAIPGGGATRQAAYRVDVKFNSASPGAAGPPS